MRFTASDRDALQFFEGVAEVIENVAWQQRLLGLITIKNSDFSGTPACPRTDSCRIVRRETLP